MTALQFNRYVLKKPVITDSRLQKIAKNILDECFKDRERALEVYSKMVNYLGSPREMPSNIDAVKGAIESLKLAQSTFNSVLKLVEVMVKLNITMSSKETNTSEKKDTNLYSSLEELARNFDNES